ncbi:MAG: hypothetical protein PSV35_09560 [bacterium]|nr:hypothetical protein [bacterium]
MVQQIFCLQDWLVLDGYSIKAHCKYQIKVLEAQLSYAINELPEYSDCPELIKKQCKILADNYQLYLKRSTSKLTLEREESLTTPSANWREHYQLIINCKKQLRAPLSLDDEAKLLAKIATRYYLISEHSVVTNSAEQSNLLYTAAFQQINNLFREVDLQSWLRLLIEFWNQFYSQNIELALIFHHWQLEQLQNALDFYATTPLIHLTNALFFYKLYPEQLFTEVIPPEKLISVRIRTGLLHQYIEKLQQQLYSTAVQYGLKPKIDFIVHGEELPQGVSIKVSAALKKIIQSAVPYVLIQPIIDNETQQMLARLRDVVKAYQFGFNPILLIDAIIYLQHNLVKGAPHKDTQNITFHSKMVTLFAEFSTSDCLNLYRCFSNNDSINLLQNLYGLLDMNSVEWLPLWSERQKKLIERLINSLISVMAALCSTLNNRDLLTQRFVYERGAAAEPITASNKAAVLRMFTIYDLEFRAPNDSLEQLFLELEQMD